MTGGAENLWAGLLTALNQIPKVEAELVTLPTPERSVPELLASYRQFDRLDLTAYDFVISGKYPAWMVRHPRHIVYMLHKLRGLYDLYPPHLPETVIPAIWQDLALPLEIEAALRWPTSARLDAIDIIDAVTSAVADLPSDHPALSFPGPFARALLKALDAIALSPDKVHRYAALSDAVRTRPDYFPDGVSVAALHIPTHLKGLRRGPAKAIFTVSRLDPAKRIDLIIKGYRESNIRIPLRIAGTGPAESALRDIAKGNPRIQFLGRIPDDALIEEYAEALFVPFMPYQEDFGLVAVEAMAAGKPVLTTTDSGGAQEQVRHDETGWITAPTVGAVAEGFRTLCADLGRLDRLGEAAQATATALTWENLTQQLLPEAFVGAASLIGRARPKLIGINSFAITPVANGGQVRLSALYGEVAREVDVQFVNLAGGLGRREERKIASDFTEICVPVAAALARKSGGLGRRLGGAGALDLAAALYPELAPEWLDALRRAALDADLIVCAHPYGHPAWRMIGLERPLVYESLNVEYDMKLAIYGPSRSWALDAVRQIEGDCIAAAQAVTVCSPLDSERMRALYDIGERPMQWLPNGVYLAESTFVRESDRTALGAAVGKQRPLALFMASTHGPNIEALPEIVETARQCPEIDFVVMGSVGQHLLGMDLPANLRALGMVSSDEKTRWLALADLGLNPIKSGSGTNLKLAEHAASGNLIISTPFGARGIAFEPDQHYVAQDDHLAPALRRALALSPADRTAMIERARETMLRTANWEHIGRDYAGLITRVLRDWR